MLYANAIGLQTVELNAKAVKEIDTHILANARAIMAKPEFIGDKPTPLHEAMSDTDLLNQERANMARQQYLQLVYSHYSVAEKQEELEALDAASVYNFRVLSNQKRDNSLPVPDWRTGMDILQPVENVQQRLSMLKVILGVVPHPRPPMPDHPRLVSGLMSTDNETRDSWRAVLLHKDGIAVMREIMEHYATAD